MEFQRVTKFTVFQSALKEREQDGEVPHNTPPPTICVDQMANYTKLCWRFGVEIDLTSILESTAKADLKKG